MVEAHICLELTVPLEDRELISALLSPFPTTGIEESETGLLVYFPATQWDSVADEVQAILKCYFPTLPTKVQRIEPQDWYAKWLEQLSPVWLCKDLVIHPFPDPPQPDSYPTARDVLYIVPALAFGTGHHASTRLAARLLLRSLRPETVWIDAGTGSGILAIIAARRGAKRVYAIDNNPYAVEQARLNVQHNNVAERIVIVQADLEGYPLPIVDGIIANLHAELLMRFASRVAAALTPGGLLIASGILVSDFKEVAEKYQSYSFSVLEQIQEEEWVGLIFQLLK